MKLLKDFFKYIFYIFCFSILGKLCNSALSATNIFEISENIKVKYTKPFIFTLSFLEILYTLTFTLVGSILVILFFQKDFFRIRKITRNIIVVELFLFSFIYGTYQFNLISLKEINFEYKYDLLFFLYLLLIYILTYFLYKEEKENYINNLYKSRERYLSTIDFYLENMKAFSIIGKWGIGKTKLIENFFKGNYCGNDTKKYSDKYEFIYIDTSIYSENEKIVNLLQKELGNLLKKYGFLDLKGNFIKNLFLENESFLKIIYKFIFSSVSLEDTKTELDEKIQEISSKKKVVICLDNLERINDRNRIIKLLAILDEILPEKIKIIYIYDEDYMKSIFKKDDENFIEYISKYVFNKIVVDNINVNEVLSDREDIAIEIEKICKNLNTNLAIVNSKIDREFTNYTDETNKLDILKEKIKEKFEEIKLKLNNPRYLNNLKEYIGDSSENINYRIEYKIIRDNFFNLTLDSILEESLELEEILQMREYRLKLYSPSQEKVSLANLEILDKDIEKICQMYIFEVKYEIQKNYSKGKYEPSTSPFKDKKIFFECYYNNIETEKTSMVQRLKSYKENPQKYFFEIIDMMESITSKGEPTSEIESYLNKNYFIYNIRSEREINRFLLSGYSNKILNIILPRLEIYDNNNFKEEPSIIVKSILIHFLKSDDKIKNLFLIKFDKDTYEKYSVTEFENFENFFKEKFSIRDLKEMSKILYEALEENKTLINGVTENFYEEIKEAIEVFEKLCNIKIKKDKNRVKIQKIPSYFFERYNAFKTRIEDGKFIITSNIDSTFSIKITKENVDEYLSQLNGMEKELSSKQEKEEHISLKIELLKFKNILV